MSASVLAYRTSSCGLRPRAATPCRAREHRTRFLDGLCNPGPTASRRTLDRLRRRRTGAPTCGPHDLSVSRVRCGGGLMSYGLGMPKIAMSPFRCTFAPSWLLMANSSRHCRKRSQIGTSSKCCPSIWPTCQSWYPLKSENASPSGTCIVYLSYAENGPPTQDGERDCKCRARCRDQGQNTARGRDRRCFGHNHSPRLVGAALKHWRGSREIAHYAVRAAVSRELAHSF